VSRPALRGAEAVVLGGSRVTGSHKLSSDWDLGVYYRGAIDLTALAAFGTVFPPGSWGRIMNGGAWLGQTGWMVSRRGSAPAPATGRPGHGAPDVRPFAGQLRPDVDGQWASTGVKGWEAGRVRQAHDL